MLPWVSLSLSSATIEILSKTKRLLLVLCWLWWGVRWWRGSWYEGTLCAQNFLVKRSVHSVTNCSIWLFRWTVITWKIRKHSIWRQNSVSFSSMESFFSTNRVPHSIPLNSLSYVFVIFVFAMNNVYKKHPEHLKKMWMPKISSTNLLLRDKENNIMRRYSLHEIYIYIYT